MTYAESFALMNDLDFRGRIQTACIVFAKYCIDEAPSTPGHSGRYRWAQATYVNPTMSAQQVQPPVVMDDAVQAAGSAIPDDQLQTAVETAVQKFL